MTPRAIGRRLFTDGLTRPVYEAEWGQSDLFLLRPLLALLFSLYL
jgi:hypothetical protein